MKCALSTAKIANVTAGEFPATRIPAYHGPVVGRVITAREGFLEVDCGANRSVRCEVLASAVPTRFETGDRVLLLLPPTAEECGVVMGRLAAYHPKDLERNLIIEASESVRLKCGEASIDLRADGKVMVRGEDVLLRAKGTQRIRAGTVSIN